MKSTRYFADDGTRCFVLVDMDQVSASCCPSSPIWAWTWPPVGSPQASPVRTAPWSAAGQVGGRRQGVDIYGAVQRYGTWWGSEVNCVGSISSSWLVFASVVCVFCLEPLWHVPVSSTRGPLGGGGQRRTVRQDVPGKESPNRHSKVSLVVRVSGPLSVWMRL